MMEILSKQSDISVPVFCYVQMYPMLGREVNGGACARALNSAVGGAIPRGLKTGICDERGDKQAASSECYWWSGHLKYAHSCHDEFAQSRRGN
jgi:hypothetical protein